MNEQALPSASTTAKYTVSLPLPNDDPSKSFTTIIAKIFIHQKAVNLEKADQRLLFHVYNVCKYHVQIK